MADFSSIPNFHLKLIFVVHFVLASLAGLGLWTSSSYLYYNFVLIAILLLAIHQSEPAETIRLAIIVNGINIVLDIVLLVLGYPDSDRARERFSAALVIIQLLVRPFTNYFLAKLLQDGVGSAEGIGNIFAGSRNRNYEDMDKTFQQPTSNQASYDFSQAQQI